MSGYGTQPFSVGRGANKNNADYWRPDNLNALFPRISPQPETNNTQASSWWFYDAHYIRLKNLQVSYALPASILQKIGIARASIIASGQNLHTWSNFIYYDPETSSSSIGYPASKVFSMGVNVTFR